METEVQKFFKAKCIFLTGGSGFVGKVFIEKVLRSTEVEKIYVLVRPKRGKDINARIKEMFKEPLFENLHQIKPNPEQYIVPVTGDCSLPHLGLSEYDKNDLMDNVDIIIHAAATVLFNEPLSYALNVNVRATLDLTEMAKRFKKLQSYVHVSTAFSNCYEFYIEEKFYCHKVGMSAVKACTLANVLGAEELNRLSPEFVKKFPNTYTYTKSLAEEAILSKASKLPICVFRPGIVTPAAAEPLEGWIDNLYGPTGVLHSSAHGYLKMKYMVSSDFNANLVPVDFCVNIMMVCAWETAKQKSEGKLDSPIPIFNFVPEEENMVKYKALEECIDHDCAKIPSSTMVWFPMLVYIKSKLAHQILVFLCHKIPAYICDMAIFILGKPLRFIKMQKKVDNAISLLDYFCEHQFSYSTRNTRKLWDSLSEEDKKLFNFDMAALDWKKYMKSCIWGLRLYYDKEDPSTIPEAKKRYVRFKLYHQIVRLSVYGLLLLCFVWFLFIVIGYL